jgi:hypothetical protein
VADVYGLTIHLTEESGVGALLQTRSRAHAPPPRRTDLVFVLLLLLLLLLLLRLAIVLLPAPETKRVVACSRCGEVL